MGFIHPMGQIVEVQRPLRLLRLRLSVPLLETERPLDSTENMLLEFLRGLDGVLPILQARIIAPEVFPVPEARVEDLPLPCHLAPAHPVVARGLRLIRV